MLRCYYLGFLVATQVCVATYQVRTPSTYAAAASTPPPPPPPLPPPIPPPRTIMTTSYQLCWLCLRSSSTPRALREYH